MPKSISQCFITVGLLSVLPTGTGRQSKEKEKKPLMFKESAFTDVSHKTAKKSSRVIVRDYLESARSNAERKFDRQWSSFIFDFSYWSSELTQSCDKKPILFLFHILVERTIDGDIVRQHSPWVFYGKCININYVLAIILG